MSASSEASDANARKLITIDELDKDYDYLWKAAQELLNKPDPIAFEDEADLSAAREDVKALLSTTKRVESKRVEVKEPYLDGTRTVDKKFNSVKEALEKKQATIERVAKRYLDAKAAAEERRRLEEAARLKAEADKRDADARAAQKKVDDARRAADALRAQQEADARKAEEDARRIAEENQRRAQAIADAKEREEQEKKDAEQMRLADMERQRRAKEDAERLQLANAASAAAGTEATLAANRSLDASSASLVAAKDAATAKPADLARTRTEGGGLATLRQSFDFEITEPTHLDLEALRSYIPTKDLEKAIRRYVDTHKDTKPLAGVRIFAVTEAMFQ